LSDERLRELLEVQAYFGLPSPALVEKDFYVVKALAAIAAIDTAPLRLVFGGGTALSRAHRLVRRMSEDIDLRIVSDKPPGRGALRRLRDAITQALLSAGFKFDARDPAYRKSGNESRYTIYRLPYEPAATGEGALRPTIQIETAVWPLRRTTVELAVISFMAEALQRPPEVASMACVSILETAADKFVGLTRRAGAELAGLDERDPTLVRHLHDLHALREHYDATDVVALRARSCSPTPRPTAISSGPIGRTLCARRCGRSKGLRLIPAMPGGTGNFSVFNNKPPARGRGWSAGKIAGDRYGCGMSLRVVSAPDEIWFASWLTASAIRRQTAAPS
jgi:predicted nucleotidyltransferase component of viral defense system